MQHVASLSDHCGVLIDMSFQNLNQHRKLSSRQSYWKLNVSILEDEDFEGNFVSLWTKLKLKQASFSDIADWWEIEAKPAIREFCLKIFHPHAKTCSTSPLYSESCNFLTMMPPLIISILILYYCMLDR